MPTIRLSSAVDGVSGPSHDFTTNLNRPIDLTDGDYELCLVDIYHYFSFYNISAELGNNLISYNNGSTDRNLTIPNGQWNVEYLNNWLHTQMIGFGDFTTVNNVNEFDISIIASYEEGKVRIEISNSYTLDLTQSTINELLGFNSAVINTTTTGQNPANINNGVNNLAISCDIINGSVLGAFSSNVIAFYKINNLPFSLITHEVPHKIWYPISGNQISSIRIQITDQDGNSVNLNNEPVSLTLEYRKIKNLNVIVNN